MAVIITSNFKKGATQINLNLMRGLLTKLLEGKKKDILTMTFFFTHKLRNVGGPLLWEALGRGLLGLCLNMALVGINLNKYRPFRPDPE